MNPNLMLWLYDKRPQNMPAHYQPAALPERNDNPDTHMWAIWPNFSDIESVWENSGIAEYPNRDELFVYSEIETEDDAAVRNFEPEATLRRIEQAIEAIGKGAPPMRVKFSMSEWEAIRDCKYYASNYSWGDS